MAGGRARRRGRSAQPPAPRTRPPPSASAAARHPERLQELAVVRIERERAPQLPAGDVVAPKHLLVEEPELVPGRPVQRLQVDRLRIELARAREVAPSLLGRGPGLE